ncbi:hypothetical protein GWK47_035153 [Chionoecetes opilio]|uniref:Uncharacterized protein n=1 Tax=Chionoecetes opilio TaxID=41210 RepID=A0A8J4YNG7_CHIOP|nr:hypothetical protein GWK47_035153 [Chionoecetes opilio]
MGESVWQGQEPRESLFKHFKDVWTDFTTDNPTTRPSDKNWLNKKKKECKEILKGNPEAEKPPRADYREMAELTLIVLGDPSPRNPLESSWSHFIRPGGWPENLYSMKMFMFSEQLEYDEETVVKLERLPLFLGLFYTPMWMSSNTCCRCLLGNDLQFYEGHDEFKRTDPEIAQAVLQKLENHKWYLTQEIVPFALFGSRLSDKREAGHCCQAATPLRSQIASDEENPCSLRLQPRRLWLI